LKGITAYIKLGETVIAKGRRQRAEGKRLTGQNFSIYCCPNPPDSCYIILFYLATFYLASYLLPPVPLLGGVRGGLNLMATEV